MSGMGLDLSDLCRFNNVLLGHLKSKKEVRMLIWQLEELHPM